MEYANFSKLCDRRTAKSDAAAAFFVERGKERTTDRSSKSRCLILLCLVWFISAWVTKPLQAEILIYFEENGGGGNPRGLYDYDTDTGISSLRTTVPGAERFFGMDVRRSDNAVFAVDLNSDLWTINPDTGGTSLIGDTGLTSGSVGIAFDPFTDALFVLENSTDNLYSVNPTNASASLIGSIGFGVDRGLSFSPSGDLYAYSGTDLYLINPATAMGTLVGGPTPAASVREDSTFTPSGRLFVTDFDGNIYETNPATGVGVLNGTTGQGSGLLGLISAESLAGTGTVVVPECSTVALALMALLSLGFSCWRRQ